MGLSLGLDARMVEARDRRGTGTKASTQSGQTTVNGPLNPISGSDTRVIAAVRPGAARREWSGSKQSKGHYRDAVLAAVGVHYAAFYASITQRSTRPLRSVLRVHYAGRNSLRQDGDAIHPVGNLDADRHDVAPRIIEGSCIDRHLQRAAKVGD